MSDAGVLRGGVRRPLRTTFGLWYGALGAPAVWLVRISVASALVPYACATGRVWVLHVTTVAAAALSIAAGALAWILLPGAAPAESTS